MQSSDYNNMTEKDQEFIDSIFKRETKTVKELCKELNSETKLEMLRLRKEKFKLQSK